MLNSVFTILGVIAATATGIGAALTALHNTLMGFGLGWGALIESYLLLGIHGAAFTTVGGLIAALTLAATAAGMALALADALYGYKGVDVFVAYGPAYILLQPPTIERQQGERWSQGTQDNPSSFIKHGSEQLFPNPASIQLSR